MKRDLVVLGIVALCLAMAVPAGAAEKGWHLRVFAAGFDPDLDVTVPAVNPEEVRITADSDLGFGASLEYQFSNLLGVEFGVMQGSPVVELSADIPGYGHLSLTDSMSTTIMALDLDFHLTPNSQSFDVYVGGGIASVGYGNLHYIDPDGDPLDLVISDDLTWSVKAGLGISLGKNSRWSALGGLRYIGADLEAGNAADETHTTEIFDFDTISFSVGIGYSF